MPQLPNGPFGPIPSSVVLDGSGNGILVFQPNGKNARITNLFGKVSTSTRQAVVSVYLGQIADSNRVFNSNSGSTGFTAQGTIDVSDGQLLYVQWVGGDAGATASATFSGTTVPFGEGSFGGFSMSSNDPVAAGDGSLVYPAIKSPDFTTGVDGWNLDRDGDVELNSAVIRGELVAGGGVVTVNSDGIDVVDVPNGYRYRVDADEGLIASRLPDDGSYGHVVPGSGPTGGAFFAGQGINPGPSGGVLERDGYMFFGWSGGFPYAILYSPKLTGKERAFITVYGQSEASATDNSQIDLNADEVKIYSNSITVNNTDSIVNGTWRADSMVGWGADNADGAAIGTTETVTLTIPSITYRRDRAYRVESYGKYTQSVAAATQPVARIRKTNTAGQVLVDNGRWNMPAVTTTIGQNLVGKFTVGSADVTTVIVMTLQTQVNTLTQKGDANQPRNVYIYDIGDAANYPEYPVLV